MKLTPSQAHAMTVLRHEYQCAYEMRLLQVTLDALVRKGLAERKQDLGSSFSPRTTTLYRLKLDLRS